MDCHAIVSECRQQTPHGRMRAETASDERVRVLLGSMALIWTKLAEEAEPIQRTKRGVANDDTAGQTQVPPGSASDAMPTLQDTDESAQVDRDGGILLLATLFGMYPFLQTLFADAGYPGRQFHNAL